MDCAKKNVAQPDSIHSCHRWIAGLVVTYRLIWHLHSTQLPPISTLHESVSLLLFFFFPLQWITRTATPQGPAWYPLAYVKESVPETWAIRKKPLPFQEFRNSTTDETCASARYRTKLKTSSPGRPGKPVRWRRPPLTWITLDRKKMLRG